MLTHSILTSTPNVAILGAGAIGLLYGTYLSQVCNIHLIDTRLDTEKTDSSILKIKRIQPDGRESRHLLKKVNKLNSSIDYLLVCTKSHGAEAAIQTIENQLKAKTKIVLFQNGMGFQQTIADKYPRNEIIIASTTEGANRSDNTSLIHAANGKTILGHLIKPTSDEGINLLQSLLIRAGFDTLIENDINSVLWRKLIINCGINPYTALLDCPNGEILTNKFFLDTISDLSRELSDIARLEAVEYSPEQCKNLITSVAESTCNNISSTLQDVRKHRKTEIQAMNGFIVRKACEAGLCCPINESLVSKVTALETGFTP